MDQVLINLALALAANEVVHNIAETMNVREKVRRLKAYIDKDSYKEMSVKIDTRAKAYAISVAAFVVVVGVLFGFFSLMNLNGNQALWWLIGMLVVAYFSTAVLLDKYHVDIERVTRPFMKKK